MRKKAVAVLELLLAASLWGFGFVAAAWALKAVDAFELTLSRFVLALLVGWPVLVFGPSRREWKSLLFLSFIPSILLSGCLIFQTWGLEYTTPTKSGFVTTLYVVFVPLLEALRRKRRLKSSLWGCVFLAFVGTGLIVDIGFSQLNFGDVLTFICALFATLQIYWLGKISRRIHRPFAFNLYQCIWAALLSLPWVNLRDWGHKVTQVAAWPSLAFLGLAALAFGSTILAFSLQVRAQARLSATVSSLMFLLESPFAMIFSLIFLGQALRPLEAVGAILIFVAAFLAVSLEGQASSG